MRTRFRYLSLAAIAVLALALVACDDDDNGNGNGDPVDPTPANGTPAPDDDAENGENGENGNGASGETISLGMLDIEFSETALTIPSGEATEIALTNEGTLEHDFTIDEIDVDYDVGGDAVSEDGDWDLHVDVPPGESGSVTMTVNEPGEYDFYCTVPGHREAGMEGTLTVE